MGAIAIIYEYVILKKKGAQTELKRIACIVFSVCKLEYFIYKSNTP